MNRWNPIDRISLISIEHRFTRMLSTNVLDYLRKWIPLAILMGLIGGFGAMLLQALIEFIWSLSYETVSIPWYLIVLVPAVGGLIMGLIASYLAPETKGSGLNSVIDALHHEGGKVRPRVAPVKILTSAITLGTGGSAGREGPISQITSGLATLSSQRLKLGRSDTRILVVCGMAAGMSAVFKAPLGAAIFAMEIPYRNDLETNAVVPSVISSVVAYLVFIPFYGVSPLFTFPDLSFPITGEILLFTILIGFVLGLLGIAFIFLMKKVTMTYERLSFPLYIKTALGGLTTGIVGLAIPGVLGISDNLIQLLIDGAITSLVLLSLILVAKMFATFMTVGSGGSGGVFFPTLLVGGTVGGIIGSAFGLDYTPVLIVIGMGTLMSSVTKTPIASPIFMTEMVGGTTVLIPLMIASVISFAVSGSRTIYESQIAQQSFHLDISMLSKVKVDSVMAKEVKTVGLDETLQEIYGEIQEEPHYLYPVLDGEGRIAGVVPRELLEESYHRNPSGTIEEIYQSHYETIPSDREALEAFDLMNSKQISRMLVVDPNAGDKLVGIITRFDIIEELERLDEKHHEY